MQNVALHVEGDMLTIVVDLKSLIGVSKSGKSSVIASTHGNLDVPGAPGVKVGLNVYKTRELPMIKLVGGVLFTILVAGCTASSPEVPRYQLVALPSGPLVR